MPREELAGAVHHVFARGNGRQAIYLDDADREQYLRILGDVVAETGWRVLAYCLMPNHVHLLVETPEPNLGVGMRRLHGDYARWFNDRHDRVGHLFQGRYGALRMQDDGQLWTTAAYIADNPVRAGLCERAEDWPWSSHAAVLASESPPWLAVDRLLHYFAGLGGHPLERYAAKVRGVRPLSQRG
jgi:REP element-mobilizing transposase RayT